MNDKQKIFLMIAIPCFFLWLFLPPLGSEHIDIDWFFDTDMGRWWFRDWHNIALFIGWVVSALGFFLFKDK